MWDKKEETQNEDRWVHIEMSAGDLVLIHPQVLHRSAANRSKGGRAAYTVHIIDGAANWPSTNWIQPLDGSCEFPRFPQDDTNVSTAYSAVAAFSKVSAPCCIPWGRSEQWQ